MFEFRLSGKNINISEPQVKMVAYNVDAHPNIVPYKMDFSNMFSNITNVKPGCRRCRGTY